MSPRYPSLARLAFYRLGQDWDLVRADPSEHIRDFVRYESAHATQRLLAELDEVLATDRTDLELEQLWLGELNSCFDPVVIDLTYRQWFDHVHEVLVAAIEGPLPPDDRKS